MGTKWNQFKLHEIVDILDNRRIPVSSDLRAKRIGNIPYYGATGQTGTIDDFIFDEELVLVGEDGAPFFDFKKNVAYIINGKSWVNNHAHVLRAKQTKTNNRFVFYFLNQFNFNGFVSGTTRLKLNQSSLKSIPISLPSLTEQERIVAKLDTIFAHLEAAKQGLEKIPVLLKEFRQAVLTQAVTGKLTEEWREGKELEVDIKEITKFSNKRIDPSFTEINWLRTNVGNLSSRVSVGHVGITSEYYTDNTGIPFLRSQNVKPGKVVLEKIAYITKEFHLKLKKSQLTGGELLIVRVGANRGDATILPGGLGEVNCANIVFARVKPEFSAYLNLYFQSSKWLNAIEELSTGTAQGVINTRIVEMFEVEIPPIQEQTEIVRRVEALFSKADAIEAQYKKLKEQIDQLPQAVLAKAFRGEV